MARAWALAVRPRLLAQGLASCESNEMQKQTIPQTTQYTGTMRSHVQDTVFMHGTQRAYTENTHRDTSSCFYKQRQARPSIPRNHDAPGAQSCETRCEYDTAGEVVEALGWRAGAEQCTERRAGG